MVWPGKKGGSRRGSVEDCGVLPSRKSRSCTRLGTEGGGVVGKEERFLYKGERREQKS